MKRLLVVSLAALLPFASAQAEVELGETGFVVRNSMIVTAEQDEIWQALVTPARYWSPDHSWSGDAGNFSLEPVAGGCFCETLPNGGSVEHMRVIMIQPTRLLRLAGALGPLQSEGLAGAMSWQLTGVESGTQVTVTYVVGGYMQFVTEDIAPAVDGVVREQLESLASLFDQASE
jgi:uncharacterized protein YndB with AHSA1/START domain